MKKLSRLLLMFFVVPSALAMYPYGVDNLRRQIRREINHQLLDVAKDGDIGQVRRMLEEGAEVNASSASRDKQGWTSLHYAVSNKHEHVCKLLIANGADMNVQNIVGVSPLMIAACRGYEDICRMLIQEGADINVREVHGQDAFYGASSYPNIGISGYPNIMRMLCDRQAKLHDSIIVTLGCLRRLKHENNQCGQVLYTNADVLLKPYLALKKNYKPKRLAKMKEACKREERRERWGRIEFYFLSGVVVVVAVIICLAAHGLHNP